MAAVTGMFRRVGDERQRAVIFGGWKLQAFLALDYARMRVRPLRPPLPRMIQLEPTRRCNLDCRMCIRRRSTGAGIDMTLPVFGRLLDHHFAYRHFLLLYGQGEPFLCQDLFRMIRLERDRGNTVVTVTNGTILSPRILDDLFDSGLNILRVSIDGATPGTFESIRSGASFDDVTSNVRQLVDRRRRSGRGPLLAITFMALVQNYREIPDMVRLAADLGVPLLELKDMPPYGDSPCASLSVVSEVDETVRADLRRVLDTAGGDARRRGIRLVTTKFGVGKRRHPCMNPWFKAYVTCDGHVTPCSRFFDPSAVSFGNLARDSFASIWYGPDYTAMRRRMQAGDRPYAECVEATHPLTPRSAGVAGVGGNRIDPATTPPTGSGPGGAR